LIVCCRNGKGTIVIHLVFPLLGVCLYILQATYVEYPKKISKLKFIICILFNQIFWSIILGMNEKSKKFQICPNVHYIHN
jgi:hypothetical protein